jgi:hypothetical protein
MKTPDERNEITPFTGALGVQGGNCCVLDHSRSEPDMHADSVPFVNPRFKNVRFHTLWRVMMLRAVQLANESASQAAALPAGCIESRGTDFAT